MLVLCMDAFPDNDYTSPDSIFGVKFGRLALNHPQLLRLTISIELTSEE